MLLYFSLATEIVEKDIDRTRVVEPIGTENEPSINFLPQFAKNRAFIQARFYIYILTKQLGGEQILC